MIRRSDLPPGSLPEQAGRAPLTGCLFSPITGDGVGIIRAEAESLADNRGFLHSQKGRDDLDRTALPAGPGAEVDGPLHSSDKGSGRIRIVRGVEDIEPADDIGEAPRFGPGGGQRQENSVPEGDIGLRNALGDIRDAPECGNGKGGFGQGRAPDLAEVHFEDRMGNTQSPGQSAAQGQLRFVTLAVIKAERADLFIGVSRPVESRRRIDPTGIQDDGRSALDHAETDGKEDGRFFQANLGAGRALLEAGFLTY